MTQLPYRAGVIGAGAISQALHMPGYQKDRRAQFLAFADPSTARHAEILEAYSRIRAYTDHTKMLAADTWMSSESARQTCFTRTSALQRSTRDVTCYAKKPLRRRSKTPIV